MRVSLLAALAVAGPSLVQVRPGGDRPGEGVLGVVAIDRDLAIADLARGAGVLAGDADGAAARLGEAGVVEDQDGIALGGQFEHPPDALAVAVVLVPEHGGQGAPEALLGGAGDDLGEGVAVLVARLWPLGGTSSVLNISAPKFRRVYVLVDYGIIGSEPGRRRRSRFDAWNLAGPRPTTT